MVWLRYACGAVEVCSLYGRGALPVRSPGCGSGSVRYFNFLSDGIVCRYLSCTIA